MSVNISIGTATFSDQAKVVGEVNEGKTSRQEDNVLEQLEALRADLAKVNQLSAAITSLEAAIREQNKPKMQTIIRQLTSSFTSSFFANVISDLVNPLL